jgi:hypothetical protein
MEWLMKWLFGPKWLLVLVIFQSTNGGALSLTEKIEYRTEKLCNEAKAKIEKDNRLIKHVATATCVRAKE